MTAVYALILRDLKRLLHTKLQTIAALGQPVVYFLVMGIGLTPVYQKAGGGSYMQFIAPGIVATTTVSAAMFAGLNVLWDRNFGFLKGTLVAPVSRVQLAIGRVGGTILISALQGLLMAIICCIMGFRPARVAMVPVGVLFLLLTPLVFGSLSTAIGATAKKAESFQFVMNFLMLPIFLISGAMFPLTHLPRALLALVIVNPLSYGVDGMRAALVGDSHFGIVLDIAVLACLSVAMICVAAWRFTKMEA